MCGIVGILGREPVAGQLVDALKRLEYRGYDSAGIATVENGHLERRRAEGKLKNLQERLGREPLSGLAGIGHTRWATHGKPTENNAHPHATERLAVVHNGIIENFRELRDELEKQGAHFGTETDTEVVAHLVTEEMKKGKSPADAVRAALPRLRGAFALAFIFAGEDDLMIGARKGSPLAIGHGAERDVSRLRRARARAVHRHDLLSRRRRLGGGPARQRRRFSTSAGKPVKRAVIKTTGSAFLVDKGNHRHFMAKEIHEQPEVVAHTLSHYLDMANERVALPGKLPFDFKTIERVSISACGTAYYAGLVAKYWFERYARLPVEIDVASEFRYREAPLRKGDLAIFVSQSGETADTLASLRYAKEQGQHVLAVVNVQSSTIARESERHHADACRSRNRRRLDQGLHLPAGGAGLSCDRGRAGARRARTKRRSASWCAR